MEAGKGLSAQLQAQEMEELITCGWHSITHSPCQSSGHPGGMTYLTAAMDFIPRHSNSSPPEGSIGYFTKKKPTKLKKKKSENAQTTNVALSLLNLYPKLHLPFAGSAPILRAWVEIAQLQTLISKQEKWHRAELCSRPMLCTLASSTHTPGYNNDLL